MLVLTRSVNESIIIKVGNTIIRMKVDYAQQGRARLAFDAPDDALIDREEIYLAKEAGIPPTPRKS